MSGMLERAAVRGCERPVSQCYIRRQVEIQGRRETHSGRSTSSTFSLASPTPGLRVGGRTAKAAEYRYPLGCHENCRKGPRLVGRPERAGLRPLGPTR